jgi:GMP synthase (glutamine-hydrolysing)
MRVLSIVHEREAGSGVFAHAAAAFGATLREWIPAEEAQAPLERFDAVLVFGGAMHVDEERTHAWLQGEKELLRGLLADRVPVLGVCLGAQLLAEVAGGAAARAAQPEIGWIAVKLAPAAGEDALLSPLPKRFESFQWHSYELFPPAHASVLARSPSCVQAFRLKHAPAWGIQFHAEATAATIAGWIRDYRADADAVRAGLDWPRMLSETQRKIARSNELGGGICERFLHLAAASSP